MGVWGAAAWAWLVSRAAPLFAGCCARAGALGRSSWPGQVPGRFLLLHSWSLLRAFALCHLAAPGSQQQEENLAVPLQGTLSRHGHSQRWGFEPPGVALPPTQVGVRESWRLLHGGLGQVYGEGGGWCGSDRCSEEVDAGGELRAVCRRHTEGEKLEIQVEESGAAMGMVTGDEQRCYPAAHSEVGASPDSTGGKCM